MKRNSTPRGFPVNVKGILLLGALACLVIVFWPRLIPREADLTAVIHLENIPAGLALVGEHPKDLEVKVRGPGSKVNFLVENSGIVCRLDLSGIEQGVNTITVERSDVVVPEGISIEQVTPESLVFKADREIKRSIPVEVTTSGEPAPGHVIADAVTDPPEVILRGPESILSAIDVVKTKPVEVAGVQDSIKREVMLALPENVTVMFPGDRISSAIYVEDRIIVKEIRDVAVTGVDAGYAYTITPPVIHLKVKGPENMIESLSAREDVAVFLDLKNLTPGVYVRHATIRLPVDITLVGVDPEIFTVRLSQEQGEKEDAAGR